MISGEYKGEPRLPFVLNIPQNGAMNKLLIRTISAFVFWTVHLVFSACSASAAGNAVMNVSATIISKNICSFKTNAANLSFGVLNPISPVNVTASTAAIFTCKGSAPLVVYNITQNSGLNSTGPGGNRLKHATNPTAYLPYSLSLVPDAPSFPRETPPQDHTVTVTGTLLGADYQTALAGNYTDTVTIDIVP